MMAKERSYIDFKLELRDLDLEADRFKVAVLPSDSGEVGDVPAVTVPYSMPDQDYILNDLDSTSKTVPQEDLVTLGKALADRLLPAGPVREAYKMAVAAAGKDRGVRLRLICRTPKLARLPWEYTYDPLYIDQSGDNRFLVFNPQISLVRFESSLLPRPPLTPSDPEKLKMAIFFSNARNPGMRPLKLDVEKAIIQSALEGFKAENLAIDYEPMVEDATLEDLQDRLRAQKPDLFHFAGHGVFVETTVDMETGEPAGEGQILLEADKTTHKPQAFKAGDLAKELQAAGVRLAVIGACQTGRRDGVSPWSGVAPALLEAGLGAVVAMQYLVNDDAAVAFSQQFYKTVAAGLSVDEAVWYGRMAMLRVKTIQPELNSEWGVPVLYMRSVDGVLFPKLNARPSPTAAQIQNDAEVIIQTISKTGKLRANVLNLGDLKGLPSISQKVKIKVDTLQGEIDVNTINTRGSGDDD
jgi:hypothetical protein